MKSLLTAALLAMTMATPVEALIYDEKSGQLDCAKIGELAVEIMDNKQKEMAMSEAMAWMDLKVLVFWAERFTVGDERVSKILKEIVISAYEFPSYRGEEMQKIVKLRFRNELELMCYKSLQKKN